MRIGSVAARPVFPPRDGGGIRIHQLLLHLSRRHEVRGYSQEWSMPARRLRRTGERRVSASYRQLTEVNLVTALLTRACKRCWFGNVFLGLDLPVFRPPELAELLEWADVAVVEFPWQFSYCRRLRPDRPLVLSAHNVETLTRASHAECAGASSSSRILRHVRRVECEAVSKADLVIAVSETDRNDLVSCYGVSPDRVAVIENGSDTDNFRPLPPEARAGQRRRLGLPDGPVVVFLSAHRKVPDLAGLEWVRRLARRMPEVAFLVVGGILRPGADGNVIATGWVEDAAAYLQAADAALCPIAYGGGTKLKLFDCLATGLPTVAFAESLDGTAFRDGEHLIVSQADESAIESGIRRLLGDRALSERLGKAARAFVSRRHDWALLADRLEAELLRLCDPKPLPAATGRSSPSVNAPARPVA